MGAALHVPVLRRLLGSVMCQLQYVSRRTGRIITLPVAYARAGDTFVVLVGRAAGKVWWRNFTVPHPVDVYAGGRWRPGTGCAAARGEPAWATAAAVYAERYPRIRIADGDVFVVISFDG